MVHNHCPGWKPVFRESHKVGNMSVSLIIIMLKIRSGRGKKQRIWTALITPTTFSCLFECFSWEKNVAHQELLNLQRFGFRLHIRNIRKIWDNLRFPDRPNSFCKHYVSCFRPAVPPRVNLVFWLVITNVILNRQFYSPDAEKSTCAVIKVALEQKNAPVPWSKLL